jgi:redox-sensing transcriptional repressor
LLNSKQGNISRATIDRLPLYFRTLRLIKSEGSDIVSSEELGRRIGVTPEQIRKDLAGFGAFGKKGVGYHVAELVNNISSILGLDRRWNIAIVGVGHLGWALANYRNFISMGFHLSALFDQNPSIVGQIINGVEVLPVADLEKTIAERSVQIGVIAVPAGEAQVIADRMVAAGVHGVWNFAPVRIRVPDSVELVSEDLSVGLTTLSYHLRQQVNLEK